MQAKRDEAEPELVDLEAGLELLPLGPATAAGHPETLRPKRRAKRTASLRCGYLALNRPHDFT